MSRQALIKYKQANVNTSSRGKILLMLYDGAIRFLEQAKMAIAQGRADIKGEKISRAHAIVSELNCSLDHEVSPELCGNLEALYLFMLEQLVVANKTSDTTPIDVVIEILDGLRDSWRQVILGPDKATKQKAQPMDGSERRPVIATQG